LAGVLALCIFGLAYFSPVSYATSDPELALVVSQAILEHGVLYLDAYREELGPVWEESVAINELMEREGHWYYYFPLAPSLVSLPFVWLANQAGWDMANVTENHGLQNWLSALACAAVFLLLFQVCRCYLETEKPRRFSETYGVGTSLMVAAVSVMGSALISTVGTAWWNVDLAVVLITIGLWLLARYDSGRAETIHPYWLGFLLFATYVCRPSAAVFVAVTLVTVFFWPRRGDFSRTERITDVFRDEGKGGRLKPLLRTLKSTAFGGKGEFWKMAGSAAVLLLGYLLAHRAVSGQWMGEYTAVARFTVQRAPLWVALYGLYFSPARGLLVFSPFFGLALLGVGRLWRRPMVWLVVVWLGAHLLVVARAASWWGGWAYGPRLLTEVMPGLALLSALVWHTYRGRLNRVGRWAAVAVYLILGAWGIFANSYQGLFNVSTMRWDEDVYPLPVGEELGDLFDWRYPQFLASNGMICERNWEKMERVLALEPVLLPYRWGRPVRFDADGWQDVRWLLVPDQFDNGRRRVRLEDLDVVSEGWFPVILSGRGTGNEALFIGWSRPVELYRWSQCRSARIVWWLRERAVGQDEYLLQVVAGAYEDQAVVVLVNGVEIGTVFVPGSAVPPTTVSLSFEGRLLRPGGYNEIEFWFERPVVPGPKDTRQLGLALVEWRIAPMGGGE
jgi:hypothetical protein